MLNRNFILKVFLSIVITALIFAVVMAVIFETEASKNILVNVSKRFVAEGGAIISGNTVISKNIMKWKNGNEIPFGPEKTTHPATMKSIDGYVKKYLKSAKITGIHNYGISEYAEAFQYEDLLAPQLKFLREKYNLEKLTAGPTEMDRFIVLRNWIKNTIGRGRPKDVDYNFNAIDILSRAGKGEAFFCSEYSTVFVQCALSLGFQARYVGLFKGHAVAEVWSDQFMKWIIMDVDNDLHYERQGIPLNALELHQAWEEKTLGDVKVVRGLGRIDDSDKGKENLASYYHEFFVRMRNDWFSHRYPHWHHKGNSIMNSFEWRDGSTGNNILVARETNRKDEIYFPINVTSLDIYPAISSGESVILTIDTFMPNFSHFVVALDAGPAVIYKGPIFEWSLHKGVNRIGVKAVNARGIEGPESYIELELSQE